MNIEELLADPNFVLTLIFLSVVQITAVLAFLRKRQNNFSKHERRLERSKVSAEELKQKYELIEGVVSRIGPCDQIGTNNLILIMLENNKTIYSARNWDFETALTKVGDSLNLYANTDGKVYVIENMKLRSDLGRMPNDAGVVGWA